MRRDGAGAPRRRNRDFAIPGAVSGLRAERSAGARRPRAISRIFERAERGRLGCVSPAASTAPPFAWRAALIGINLLMSLRWACNRTQSSWPKLVDSNWRIIWCSAMRQLAATGVAKDEYIGHRFHREGSPLWHL